MARRSPQLDGVFQALADPTRRAVLGRLGRGPASIGELAAAFEIGPALVHEAHPLPRERRLDQDQQAGPRPHLHARARLLRPGRDLARHPASDLGGAPFRTEISDDGAELGPHLAGCFLAVDELERIVFTDTLLGGWRPAEAPFTTAVIELADHPEGTEHNG